MPSRPANSTWVAEVADQSLHTIHNLQLIDLNGDQRDEVVLAAWEGVFVLERNIAGRWTPAQAATELQHLPGVSYALPDYEAHIAGNFYPDDTGRSGKIHGWETVQWNFLSRSGVNAPQGWFNLLADHRPGARGVEVGKAYRGTGCGEITGELRPDAAGTLDQDGPAREIV